MGAGVTIPIPRDQYAFAARLTWPASDMFLAMWPALDAAEASVRARQYQSEAVEAQIARNARETYYQLARARGALAVAEQAQRQAEAQRARVEASVRAGFLTQADRLAADARVTAAEQAAALATAGVEVTDAALRSLLAQDDGPIYGIAEPVLNGDEVGEPEALRAAMQHALSHRPELAAMRETLAAQRAAAQANDATGYPHVAIYGAADLSAPSRYVIPPNFDLQPSWEVGATLSWAPNDALIAAHRGEELAAQYAATEAELEQLQRAVTLEVRQAHASVRAARRTLEAARAALSSAEAAYQSRDAQLRAGEATAADLASAQNDLDRARLGVLDAAVQLRTARAQLAYATGR
jgi:outer membrane protein TolC